MHQRLILARPHGITTLTQSEGKLVEPLQLCHQGADCIPGFLLKSEVTGVLDGLQARRKSRCSFRKNGFELPNHLYQLKVALHFWYIFTFKFNDHGDLSSTKQRYQTLNNLS